MNQLNIVYLHSHDTGRYVSPYGHAVRTPHLQRFAQQGVMFRQAFCANPTCSPSRAALLCGQYAHNTGMLGLMHRGFRLEDPKRHMGHTLQQAGYETVLAGLQHVSPEEELDSGVIYSRRLEPDGKHVADVVPGAVSFLEEGPREPFFLDAGFFETHRVFPEPDAADDPRYTRPPAPLPDTPEVRRDMAGFNTMAHQLDEGIGQVLAAIDQAGLAERTLVLITTDHGPAFPAMKCQLTDHGTGVMLMLRGPQSTGLVGGKIVDAMVSQVDVFPTLCELIGLEPPAWLQGVSMMPTVRGEAAGVRDEVFAEVNCHAAYEPKRSVRTQRYKYIRRYHDRSCPVLPNCDNGPSKDAWLAHGWAERPEPEEQLYDLMFDPNEACNLAADSAHAPVLREMRERLARWMRQTADPLMDGALMLSAGVRLTPMDARAPGDPAETIETARPGP